MRKFICSNFEIDLSKLKISDVQENPWFTDKFFSKFTFPFEMDLSEENDINFGFIGFYNANSHTTQFKGKYVHRNVMEDAILEIEEVSDKITLSLSYGFDEFPNFKKKLSELPLDKFEVTDIYDHAETIIPQTWPAVNYNFPQIHIDKIDNTQSPWESFEGIINNYKDGAFLINEVDVDDITHNRNIMQPLPYALHILQKGFEDAGKTLTGDVLTDDRIKKMCIYADVEYWTTFEQESYTILKMSDNLEDASNVQIEGTFSGPSSWSQPIVNPVTTIWRYFEQIDISSPGKYRIIGKVKMINPRFTSSRLIIKYRDQIILQRTWIPITNERLQIPRDINVNVVFETLSDLDPNYITIELFNGSSSNKVILDLGINPIRLHDVSGTAIPTIVNLNQVDLTRAVPKITFGEYVTAFKNWFNLDITPNGNEIIMNFVKNEKKNAEVFDLSRYEVVKPVRKFTRGISFLLQFQEVKTTEYTFLPVYHSIEQIATSDFKTDDKTNEISINALPLPYAVRNNIQTAHAFDADESKIYAVIYDGLNADNLNLTKPSTDLLLENVHETCWKEWMDFRIKGPNFNWPFVASFEEIQNLYYKGKVFAYGLHHVVKNLNRTEIAEDLFEIEIETEAEV